MRIKRTAICGTLESSDVQISVLPGDGTGLRIDLSSVVENIFGDAILAEVRQVLRELDITEGEICLVDQGALDCVIRSRLQTALLRACEEDSRRLWKQGEEQKEEQREKQKKEYEEG